MCVRGQADTVDRGHHLDRLCVDRSFKRMGKCRFSLLESTSASPLDVHGIRIGVIGFNNNGIFKCR